MIARQEALVRRGRKWAGLFLGLWMWSFVATAADDYETRYTIFDFRQTRRFSAATSTDIATIEFQPRFPTGPLAPSNRYVAYETIFRGRKDFSVNLQTLTTRHYTDPIYADLQRQSLLEMLKNGYISRTLYDSVINTAGKLKETQVIWCVAWTEMSYDEAYAYFGGKIPWNRVMFSKGIENREFTRPFTAEMTLEFSTRRHRDEPLRIVRSSIMMALGHEIDDHTGSLVPLALPWQTEDVSARTPPPNRALFPYLAEFKRGVAEGGDKLPGSLRDPIHVLVAVALREARRLNLTPRQMAFYGHTLDLPQAHLFAKFMGQKVMDENLDRDLRTNPSVTIDNFAKRDSGLPDFPPRSLPRDVRRAQMKALGDLVLFTPLSAAPTEFHRDDVSARSALLREYSGFRLDARSAESLLDLDVVHNAFHIPGFGGEYPPVFVIDSSSVKSLKLARAMQELGIANLPTSKIIHTTLLNNHIPSLASFEFHSTEPGMLTSPDWIKWEFDGPNFTFTIAPPDMIQIVNLSEEPAQQFPYEYLLTVLFSVYEDTVNCLQGISREDEDRLRLLFEPKVTVDIFPHVEPRPRSAILREARFSMASTSPVIATQLRNIAAKVGASVHPAEVIGVKSKFTATRLPNGTFINMKAAMSDDAGVIALFTPAQIERLRLMPGTERIQTHRCARAILLQSSLRRASVF
jgi:hypothetical protein